MTTLCLRKSPLFLARLSYFFFLCIHFQLSDTELLAGKKWVRPLQRSKIADFHNFRCHDPTNIIQPFRTTNSSAVYTEWKAFQFFTLLSGEKILAATLSSSYSKFANSEFSTILHNHLNSRSERTALFLAISIHF